MKLLLLTLSLLPAFAALPPELQGIGIDQHLNASLPLETQLQNDRGETVTLRQFFHGKPVLIAPVYYRCPMLCSQILHGIVSGLRPLSLKPSKDFEVVVFSIDPTETPADAAAKRSLYATKDGWHFLVAKQPAIDALTAALGFHYRRDPNSGMFIHASGLMIVTPEGKLARYFYGVEYQPKDLKLGLIEASHNRIGSRVDQVLLFCYHYDPSTGKYSLLVLNTLKLAAILTVLFGFTGLFVLWRRDLKGERHPILADLRSGGDRR